MESFYIRDITSPQNCMKHKLHAPCANDKNLCFDFDIFYPNFFILVLRIKLLIARYFLSAETRFAVRRIIF